MNNNPIAVIDSGVGGLSCLPAIIKAMPKENIIYLGDTLHAPYGSKSEEQIRTYAHNIGSFLQSEGVKMVIIACGTMSSIAIDCFYKDFPDMIVQGIIEPGVSSVSRACSGGEKVGILATLRTIESGAHAKIFEKLSKRFELYYKACPKLAGIIENGVFNGPEMEAALKEYLDELVYDKKIDALLLGCTHYPFASECIKKLYPGLKLIDPAENLARASCSLLKVHEMDAEREQGSLRILSTKRTESMEILADRIGCEGIKIEEVSLE